MLALTAEGAIFLKQFEKSVKNIGELCFKIPRYRSEDAYRERAYCYELYHQLRINLPGDFPYTLHGEVDKRGYDFINANEIPDFILHKPNTMDNLVIVEVKTIENYRRKYRKDFNTLKKFTKELGPEIEFNYKLGIWLVFGKGNLDKDITRQFLEQGFLVYHHKVVGKKPILINMEDTSNTQ